MRKLISLLTITCFVTIGVFSLWATEPEQDSDFFNQRFSHQGLQYLLTVEKSPDGFALFLDDGLSRKNLSLNLPGENLFPKVHFQGDHFYITWIRSHNRFVHACFYNSAKNTSITIPGEGFHFLSTPEIVFLGNQPQVLVFLGNRGFQEKKRLSPRDNDDVFAYHLETGRLVNITESPENEKVFSITVIPHGFCLHTDTLPYEAVYTVHLPGLRSVRLEKKPRASERDNIPVSPPQAVTPEAYNTLVGFGDSITWGKIRMHNLTGEYHPELAYLGVIETFLAENYRPVHTVNLGIPGETSYAGARRLEDDFTGLTGYFCMIMFGTNDVGQNAFSSTSSVENLEWICTQIRDTYHKYPIISTIPPMTHISGEQYLKENSEELNGKIIEMALNNNIPYIDTYSAFFAAPDWTVLVEDILGNHEVGNHPSPAGHQVIAGLFLDQLLLPPPQTPSGFQVMDTGVYRSLVQWTGNYEFDFSHYVIEFGYTRENLNRVVDTENSYYMFTRPPFQFSSSSAIYFRVRAVDQKGYTSPFTNIMKMEFK